MNKVIFLVDMQSFYASIEKSANPKLKDQPVVVAGDPERRSGIILAACPIAKQYGVKTAEALWEAKQKCPELVIVRPRMKLYIDISYQITQILERFTDQTEVFSVDEQFMDLTGTERLFGDMYAVAKKVQGEIQEELGVYARVGIGPNKILAKIACDAFAKKNEDGIFYLSHDNMQETMWKLPVGKMFGVGGRMERHLQRMGIQTIGELANYPLQYLKKRWGINGEVLSNTANGIDYSPVTTNTHNAQKAVGHHMTLPRDYESLEDIKIVLLELSEEVAKRARGKHYRGHTVSLGVRGANFDQPTGFHRQIKLTSPTNYGMDIFHATLKLLNKHWDGLPVRSVGVTLSQLQSADVYQLSLFDPSVKKDQLSQAMDDIRLKFGQTAIVRASSLHEAGQVFDRAKKIGGHYK
ncbi:DNA polymerase IV [Tenuibacillus multivorans]|uniref:DNA polymerase IV n=1 Tax=Tenuibacillus multivorans TaxID=237069 RepID=A0A1H0D171_9BACI|nr:DNA polymerase IV [Tenuibacillus multivorans]GEL76088.1 DNA polymerase IV 2 [Tenuibacillus multivorans]SDN63786.1 DNA polymerase-4/DNA polymerase V [Tenuibacillus multivorans]